MVGVAVLGVAPSTLFRLYYFRMYAGIIVLGECGDERIYFMCALLIVPALFPVWFTWAGSYRKREIMLHALQLLACYGCFLFYRTLQAPSTA